MDKEKKDILEQQDWPTIIKELTLYAHSRFTFWKLLDEKGVNGYSPEDIAYEAIELVLVGKWNWDSNRSELLYYLKFCVVKALVGNLARLEEVKSSDQVGIEELRIIESFSLEDDLNAKQVLDIIQNELQGDKLLIGILNGLYDQLKRADICEMLDIDLEIYDNALRRLKFRLLKLKKKGILKSLIN